MWVVVTVASARAPSSTPFLAAGAAGAGAGAAGLLLQLGQRRRKLAPAVRAIAVVAVALAVAFPAGAAKYTYGGSGSVAVSILFSPVVLEHDAATPLIGTLTLVNEGGSTVRIRPHFEVRVTDSDGFVLPPLYGSGCTLPVPQAPTEHDLVELAAGASYPVAFRLPVAWTDQGGATAECGSVVISRAGQHHVSGFFSSAPFDAFALVPVWTGTLSTENLPLDVR